MEGDKVSSSQYNNEVQTEEVVAEEERKDDDDDNKEINIASRQAFSVKSVKLEDCNDTHFGNKEVYHGSVEVNHTFEIPTSQPISPPTSPPFPNNGEFPTVQSFHTAMSTSHLPTFYSPGGSWASHDGRDHSRSVPSEYPYTDNEPLIEINKRGHIMIRLKYCILILITLLVIILAVVLTIFIYGYIKKSDNLPVKFLHFYRKRSQWGAMAPKHSIPTLKYLPTLFAVVSHTESQPCSTPDDCILAIRNIQDAQMAAPFDDIIYDFLVAGDGLIYEGRGWMERSAAVRGMGCSSLSIAFVGNFTNVIPPQHQIDAFDLLLDTSVSIGKLAKKYILFTESDIIRTRNPERTLNDIIRKSKHWQPFGSEYFLCGNTLE